MKIHPISQTIVLLASLLVSAGCSKHKAEPVAETPIPVELRAAQLVAEQEKIAASGSVASPHEPSNPSFLVSGRILRVLPREGDAVAKGQLLATMDAKDYDFAVDAAKAQTLTAQVALSRAADEYRRMKALYDLKSLAPNDFERYKAAYESAQKQVDQAQASENSAHKRVKDAVLTAPISGYVSKRMIEPGNILSAGTPAFQLVTLDPVEIQVGIPETDIAKLRVGQKASVYLAAQPEVQFAGTIKQMNVVADAGTRTYSVRITVPNPEHKLRIGMIAQVQIQGDKQIKALTLPGSAVVHDPQGANIVYVYYPQQKRVFAKHVDIAGVYGQEVRVRAGIAESDQVVIGGQQFLRDGTLVAPSQVTAAQAGSEVK